MVASSLIREVRTAWRGGSWGDRWGVVGLTEYWKLTHDKKVYQALMKAGELIPDNVTNRMVEDRLKKADAQDGVPKHVIARTLSGLRFGVADLQNILAVPRSSGFARTLIDRTGRLTSCR